MHRIWHDRGWDDYLAWQGSGDRRAIKRINEKDRIVFRIVEDKLEIMACKGHYE